MAFAVGIMAARARSPIANANASAQALDSRADDMRRPIPVSAGRNPADGAASCLTYLIIWSDGCPTVFDRDFGTMFRVGCGPGWNRKTHVQDPTAGVVPPPWRRANRPSARARHGAASPPRPWDSYRRAIPSYRDASDHGSSSAAVLSTHSSGCAPAFV